MSFDDAPAAPFILFETWFREAQTSGVEMPETVALATMGPRGPAVRYVLFKGLDPDGAFTFFTNYGSPKAKQLDYSPRAALAFYWHEPERQVRVEGNVERCSEEASDAYFATRPRGSQLGAWASKQSEERPPGELERRLTEAEQRFEGREVERPPHWGGFRIIADRVEFWQGQESRLHDRLDYALAEGSWSKTERYP